MNQETEVLYEGKSSDQSLEPLTWFQTWNYCLGNENLTGLKNLLGLCAGRKNRRLIWQTT